MKNTLAENMLRFGVKNLSESNIKKINEALLTEAEMVVDLKGDPRLPKVAKSIKNQYDKGIANPVEVMGQYIFLGTNIPKPDDQYMWVTGPVLSFYTYSFGGVGNAVTLQNWLGHWGGQFSVSTTAANGVTGDVVNFDPMNVNSGAAKFSPKTVADQLNLVNRIPANIVNAAWAANPNKANFIKTMSSFAASPTGKQAMTMLTGNAKAFYEGILTPATAAPVQAKPGVPVKKP